METNKVKQIHSFGQSIWLDFIDRAIIGNGKLQSLIEDDGIRGVTSNPAIFEKAISSSDLYDQDIAELAETADSNEAIFFGLAIKDIQNACDLFEGLHAEDSVDGFVSLEVSPFLALDAAGT